MAVTSPAANASAPDSQMQEALPSLKMVRLVRLLRILKAIRGFAEINKITHQNAMRHFRYDPFAHIAREECTVGALRSKAAHVDLTPLGGKGGKVPSDYAQGYATIGDIVNQMAGAFATPFADDA